MASNDLEFANNPKGAIETDTSNGAWAFLIFAALILVIGAIWASWATVEKITNGIGTVIPSKQVQVVESLETGTVRAILVEEGERVAEGQALIQIDDTLAKSKLGELETKYAAFSAELMRLEAQALQEDSFAPDLSKFPNQAQFLKDQMAVFDIERLKLANTLSVLKSQLGQKVQSKEELQANKEKQMEALKLAERELELSQNLFKKRAIPELEFLKIQRLVGELRGDLNVIKASEKRTEIEIQEAEALLAAEVSSFQAKARDRMAKVNAELSITSESIKSAKDRLNRTTLTAPANGIINKLYVASIGEVVQSGVTLAELVPEEDELLIEAKIRPQDIAFLRPGLPAIIRLTAYDYTRFGTLEGVVDRISADTITDENQETFYKVIVRTVSEQKLPPEIKIIPGLIAEVDISTGERTILEYLLRPITKVTDSAFRDPR